VNAVVCPLALAKLIHPHKVFFTILFVFLLAACSESPKYEPLAGGAVVLAFGDSVTHGTGAKEGEDYPTRLAQRSGWDVVNAGIPGDTARAAKSRIEKLLQEIEPALVIVELGGNDFLRRYSDQEVKEDLRIILRTVKRSGAMPVLVGVPELSVFRAGVGRLSDSAIYAELAKEESVLLVKNVFSSVLSDASLRADQIHPNAKGYRVLADGIAAALTGAGLLAAR
jgi:acyl-CoA thioesterase-1